MQSPALGHQGNNAAGEFLVDRSAAFGATSVGKQVLGTKVEYGGSHQSVTTRSSTYDIRPESSQVSKYPGLWKGSNFWYNVKKPKPVGAVLHPRVAGGAWPASGTSSNGARSNPHHCPIDFPPGGHSLFNPNPPPPFKDINVLWKNSILPYTMARMDRHGVSATTYREKTVLEKLSEEGKPVGVGSTSSFPQVAKVAVAEQPTLVGQKQVKKITIDLANLGEDDFRMASENSSTEVVIVPRPRPHNSEQLIHKADPLRTHPSPRGIGFTIVSSFSGRDTQRWNKAHRKGKRN